MNIKLYCQRNAAWLAAILTIFGSGVATQTLSAQTRYTYLPSPSVTDGRFYSIAGKGIQTLGDVTLLFKIASPSGQVSAEIGIFDGETGGTWDQGSVPLEYTLYADPSGDASGSIQLGQWTGASMPDNDWFTATVQNSEQARGICGDFLYVLRVRSTNRDAFSWSSFKVRTAGTIVGVRNNSFAYTAPLASMADARIVYPLYPVLIPTNYDGSWNFFIHVPERVPTLTLWDGDFDRGSYDCTDNDSDDDDTPNSGVPTWAVTTDAVSEAIGLGGIDCLNALGLPIGGKTTSNPPDDSRTPAFLRGNRVSYELTAPGGARFRNDNPSGNLEWEQFSLATAPFDRNMMDAHADSLPAGLYQLRIEGVDMSNLNALRFPYDVIGVDADGVPVPQSCVPNGSVSGTVFVDANNNHVVDPNEAGLPNVRIVWLVDYDNNGVNDDSTFFLTSGDGTYTMDGLRFGKYTARVDLSTLPAGVTPSFDGDGVGTPNLASTIVSATQLDRNLDFAYLMECVPGTATRGYWSNHPESWPVSSIKLGYKTYTRTQAIAILKRSVSGDKTYSMAAQLIASKLNVMVGTDASCIGNTITEADNWMKKYPVGSCVKSSNRAWTSSAQELHEELDDYNNGLLCAPHRDKVTCNNDPQDDNKCEPKRRTCRKDRHDDDDDDDRNDRDRHRNCNHDHDDDRNDRHRNDRDDDRDCDRGRVR